jgi:hypothetical protein
VDPVEVYRGAAVTASAEEPEAAAVLDALAGLATVRRDLDRLERELIGAARESQVGWSRIAAALGLGSRQAAEQRWLRLSGSASRDPAAVRSSRTEQRSVDEQYGVGELRRAAARALRRIDSDHAWADRHRRAALVRSTLAAAVESPPSALYALCRNAIEDLDAMRMVRLPPVLANAMRELARAVLTGPAGRFQS